jgi:phage RecT family recombinase
MNDLTVKEEGKPLHVLANKFDAMIDRFENILPPHVTPQRFKQVVMTAVAAAPDLLVVAATNGGQHSILMSSLKCASDGLIPDGREAALVAFNVKVSKKGEPDQWEKRAQYICMVKGVITKMQQSPGVKDVAARCVYQKELDEQRFSFVDSDEQSTLHHEPILYGDRGPIVGVYAYCRMRDGGFYFAPLNLDELKKIKATSKGTNTPWHGPFEDQMMLKSALKRLAKIAPMSREVQKIIDHDNETFHEIEPIAEKPKMLDRLREAKEPKAIAPQDDPETPPTDEPDVMEGEIIDGEGLAQGYDLPVLEDRISAAQAVAYATAWAALYKASNKADRDALWAQTEDAVDRVGKISSKALDICNDALNSPAEE